MTIEKRTPIPVKEAISRVVNQDIYTSVITVPLDESLNYVLAENIAATSDIPRFNKSPYDGFAIRSEDSAGAYHQNRKNLKLLIISVLEMYRLINYKQVKRCAL